MKRLAALILLTAVAAPASAAPSAPYYGPAVRWHGIGYKFGYEDHVEKDGRWRIDATVRGGVSFDGAIGMAMYRAAEKARDAGYRYIAFLGGHAWRGPGMASAKLYARPAAGADTPTNCAPARVEHCYVASVERVLRKFSGPDGTQPGVAVADYHDQYGRSVFLSGYGAGAVVAGAVAPASAPPPAPPSAAVRAAMLASQAPSASEQAQQRFDAALRTEQSARGRHSRQGWTASD